MTNNQVSQTGVLLPNLCFFDVFYFQFSGQEPVDNGRQVGVRLCGFLPTI